MGVPRTSRHMPLLRMRHAEGTRAHHRTLWIGERWGRCRLGKSSVGGVYCGGTCRHTLCTDTHLSPHGVQTRTWHTNCLSYSQCSVGCTHRRIHRSTTRRTCTDRYFDRRTWRHASCTRFPWGVWRTPTAPCARRNGQDPGGPRDRRQRQPYGAGSAQGQHRVSTGSAQGQHRVSIGPRDRRQRHPLRHTHQCPRAS